MGTERENKSGVPWSSRGQADPRRIHCAWSCPCVRCLCVSCLCVRRLCVRCLCVMCLCVRCLCVRCLCVRCLCVSALIIRICCATIPSSHHTAHCFSEALALTLSVCLSLSRAWSVSMVALPNSVSDTSSAFLKYTAASMMWEPGPTAGLSAVRGRWTLIKKQG